jgi:NADPH2:quinone reductase
VLCGVGVRSSLDLQVARSRRCVVHVTWEGPILAKLRRQLPLNLVLLKNVSVIGTYWGSYQSATRHLSPFTRQALTLSPEHKPTRVSEVWTELFALFASGRLKPVVYNGHYTLGTLSQGLQDLENRKTWGKVVVRVRESSARGRL